MARFFRQVKFITSEETDPVPTGFIILRQPNGQPVLQPNNKNIYTPL